MATNDIVCKPTLDTFVRFGIVLAAFVGFGFYFFYDGSIGYRKANEIYCSYQAFAKLGEEATQTKDARTWEAARQRTPLIKAQQEGDELVATVEGHFYPLPPQCEAAKSCPPEASNHAAMNSSWNECWIAYTSRMHYPAQAGDHGYDAAAIREQWYAGSVCMLISLIIIGLMLRTKNRVMAIRGEELTAAGQTFPISSITRLDLRQWGKGFKGVAYATVNGKKIRLDGMTYGGFDPKKGEPAEQLMQALQARYKGEIIEYEQEPENEQTR